MNLFCVLVRVADASHCNTTPQIPVAHRFLHWYDAGELSWMGFYQVMMTQWFRNFQSFDTAIFIIWPPLSLQKGKRCKWLSKNLDNWPPCGILPSVFHWLTVKWDPNELQKSWKMSSFFMFKKKWDYWAPYHSCCTLCSSYYFCATNYSQFTDIKQPPICFLNWICWDNTG